MCCKVFAGFFVAIFFGAIPLAAADPTPGLFDRPVLAIDPGRHTAPIRRADVDSAGQTVVTGSHDKTVRLWSVADGKLMRTIRMPTGPGNVGEDRRCGDQPRRGDRAAGGWTRASDPQNQVYLFDAGTGAMTGRLTGLPNVVLHLAFSPDGRRLAAMLGVRTACGSTAAAPTEAGSKRRATRTTADNSYGVAFAPDGRLATTSYDGRLRLYDAAGKLLHSTETGHAQPFGVAFSPDGARLAVGFDDSTDVGLFDGRTLAALPAPDTGGIDNGDLIEVAWSADGATLFAAGQYNENGINPVIAWGDGGRGPRRTLPAGLNTVMSLKPLPGGDLLVASQDPWLGVLRPDGTARWTLPPLQMDARGQRSNLAVSADGTVVDFGLKQWGDDRRRFDVGALALSRDPPEEGRTTAPKQDGLAITDWVNSDSTLARRQAAASRSLRNLTQPGDPPRRQALPARGGVVAAGLRCRRDANSGNAPCRASVWAVNISGDGRLAVAAYGDGTIRWHRMDDGGELLALFAFADGSNWIAWEPGGRFASTLGARRALRWVVNRGWDEAPLELDAGKVPLSFRPDVIRRVLPMMGTMEAAFAAEEAERAEAFRRLTGGIAPGAQLHVLTAGVGDYGAAAQRLRLEFAADDAADVAAALSGQVDWPYKQGYRMTLRDEEVRKDFLFLQFDKIRERMMLAPDKLRSRRLHVFRPWHGDRRRRRRRVLPAALWGRREQPLQN